MTRSIEEFAAECDMPPWKAAEAMVRLIKRGLVAAPENIQPDDHIAWLERTYPKPQSTKGTGTT